METKMRAALAPLLAAILAASACARGEAPHADADTTADAADGSAMAVVEPGPNGYYGTEVPPELGAPRLALARADGERFDLAAERGTVALVFFGYTHCPDICPTTLSTWKRVRQGLGADTARVRFVFVSVDPERDTPDVAQRYAHQFDASFVGLSGTRAEIDSVQRGFRIASFRELPTTQGDSAGSGGHMEHGQAGPEHGAHAAGGDAYTVSHPARVFLFDPRGRWRLILPASASAEATLSDVRRLLNGE
jgi:protein SCO1/2